MRYDVWNALSGTVADVIILDSTNTTGSTSKNHLNLDGLRLMVEMVQRTGVMQNHTRVYATHFSHMNNPPYVELQRILAELGIQCAYDGLVVGR